MLVEKAQRSPEQAVEIACDESGWEGSNLSTANSDVIAYASVRIDVEVAAEQIRVLRDRSRQAREHKASHLLRANDRSALAAFLGPSGPVYGRARVHLTHKSCFVLGRVLDLFLAGSVDTATLGLRPDSRLESHAVKLCRSGPEVFGRERWRDFLIAANAVLRADRRPRVRAPVDAFFDLVEMLATTDLGGESGAVLEELGNSRSGGYAARARLLEEHVLQPVLEPLIPALTSTVLHWTGGVHPVAVVHDEQSALTQRRIRRLEDILAEPPLEMIRRPAQRRFIQLRQVDSRVEPRVQIADLLAGIARKVAADELRSRPDRELTAMLQPYLAPDSRWCRPLTDPRRSYS